MKTFYLIECEKCFLLKHRQVHGADKVVAVYRFDYSLSKSTAKILATANMKHMNTRHNGKWPKNYKSTKNRNDNKTSI